METIINKTADQITHNNNLHMQLVRQFGGKKIKNVTIACCASDKWDDEIVSKDTFSNVMLIKNPREIHLREVGGDKICVFDAPLSRIESYNCKVDGKHINLRIFDGCLWEINLEVA